MRRRGRGFRPYVPVSQRRAGAERLAQRLAKTGTSLSPVSVEGRAIARTFWGKAWCENLDRYSDFANRLPRGRTYLRNGSVIDLQVAPGLVTAMVSGSEIYRIKVKVAALPSRRWRALCRESAGAINSLVELLQGRFSAGVMEHLCRKGTGLFPSPQEIEMSCSCPDWATMCKHVAAVLYGIGARLDEEPRLLFVLRQVDAQEMIAQAGKGLQEAGQQAAPAGRILRDANLAEVFGLDMATGAPAPRPSPRKAAKTPGGRGGASAKKPQTPRKRPPSKRRPASPT